MTNQVATLQWKSITIEVERGDITGQQTEAIVNSCDESISLKHGLSAAIAKAAGPDLKKECRQLIALMGRNLAGGEAVHTGAGKLPQRMIIHTRCVDEHTLNAAYANCLDVAVGLRISSIAFPGLGTGQIGVPAARSAAIALAILAQRLKGNRLDGVKLIRFVDFSAATCSEFESEMATVTQTTMPGAIFTPTANFKPSKVGSGAAGFQMTGTRVIKCTAATAKPINASTIGDLITQSTRLWKSMHSGPAATSNNGDEDICPVCREQYGEATADDPVLTLKRCNHSYHRSCLEGSFLHGQPQCPTCKIWYGIPCGNQPLGSTMTVTINGSQHVQGFPDAHGCIVIQYNIPGGTQGPEHLRPGTPFHGTMRVAYLPNNSSGQKVCRLLELAFAHRLTFTVGDSVTSGAKNVVTWNNIHHKTSLVGGAQSFGYPDPEYMGRVMEELSVCGVTEGMLTNGSG